MKKIMKKIFKNNLIIRFILRFSSLIGIDFNKLISLKNIPRYIFDIIEWKKQSGKINFLFPIINEFNDQSGTAKGHYFHQDLLVAQYIYTNNPKKHIDVGSRVDGFVAHVASFRKIEIYDVRELKSDHPNIIFKQHDFMNKNNVKQTDSVSCLHTLEHFGLGRYNDPINVKGFEIGLENLINLVEKNGLLYISFPVGKQDEIHFNAHRVFHPKSILNFEIVKKQLELINFDCVDDNGDLHKSASIEFASLKYNFGCGIYTFRKL